MPTDREIAATQEDSLLPAQVAVPQVDGGVKLVNIPIQLDESKLLKMQVNKPNDPLNKQIGVVTSTRANGCVLKFGEPKSRSRIEAFFLNYELTPV